MSRTSSWPVIAIALVTLGGSAAVAEEVWFAGVGSLPGSGSTRWRSEAVLHNPSDAVQVVQLELRARGFGIPAAGTSLTLAAGEVRHLPDLYQALGSGPGSGVLRVDGAALIWVRTFNQGTPGTFGQDVPPVRLADIVGTGQKRVFPASASSNLQTGFRSNLLLLNMGGQTATFTMRGCNGATSVEVAGGAYDQVNNLGSWLGCPNGVFMLEVEATAPWAGYVSTVDPVTGDPTTVRGQAPPAPGTPGNRPPVVGSFAASPLELVKGEDVDLRGTFTDPDGDPVSWSLRLDPGSTARATLVGPTSGTGNLVSKVHTTDAGLLLVEVTVTDGRGGVTTAVAGARVLCHC